MSSPQIKRRSDYQQPDFLVSHTRLIFGLEPNQTKVTAILKVQRNGQHQRPLVLDGEKLTLLSVQVNGADVAYRNDDTSLTIDVADDSFETTIVTHINPAENTSLEGLYLAADAYCTQCEAEGFRKITYYPDRPDVMSEYTVTIIADKSLPHLLSNGNKIDEGMTEDGKHFVTWHDPFKKPSYLFALVAGDFDVLTDTYTTGSGRNVDIALFVDKGKAHLGDHAIASLKRAMAWDEKEYGLEYDLDIYMVVAVDFFNMGAMENKGLNVFNSKFVLADSETATDEDYYNIESVIAHEYFHNWTGNRVTCRDWFQLSLKEGLTVFRDQQFSADMANPLTTRIKNVKVMREHQFAEDASAMSHPIRPDEVVEMNNFYTVTVYDKGAEVIRMLHTMLGRDGFRRGMDLYFERHDGQAVTCDDFVNAMQDASDIDLTMFKRWYGQSGTPKVVIDDTFDPQSGHYSLSLIQQNLPTADQREKLPLHIPIALEILDRQSGAALPVDESGSTQGVLPLVTEHHRHDVPGQFSDKPVPVLLGGFSAPVKIDYQYTADELLHIVMHAQDDFSRWDASQQFYSHCIHQRANGDSADMTGLLVDGVGKVLERCADNPGLLAEVLVLPSFETLCQQVDRVDIDSLYAARKHVKATIATSLADKIKELREFSANTPYRYKQQQVTQRRLNNVILDYLALTEHGHTQVFEQFELANNMTDSLGALKASQQLDAEVFDGLMETFEKRWRDEPLVLDKWFGLHATTPRDDILSRLELLQAHAQFSANNPNRVRALIGAFAFYNTPGFHHGSGSGYRFLTDYLLRLDKVNPQVASRLLTPLIQWQKLDDNRQAKMKHQLVRLLDEPSLSADMYEKVSKSLSA
ncbi:aminopeptidase N [Aestuariibacter salexigens]|uniref:aminopeptidase N n=1 Tax=Aestuariibacter salexigens TaxID=226010 RepID=UPI0003F89134|nr:aminopeptidase N [Aestuariibacter salexigens]